jgi:two-component system, NtrC family, sensor kinase
LEQLKNIIQGLAISEEDKALIAEQIKIAQKTIAVAEFKYNRTLFDKAAITNILNASIQEIELQKKNIEQAKNEIAKNMFELNKQKELIEIKNRVLSETMNNLKETQSQLIQSEKMASLGELTAGIAHEIQNPLNFVNNFSDINTELIEEMVEEIDKGNIEEAKTLAADINTNEQKINYHGKRADGIVKGMLQHSRSNNNIKEAANINVLTDEYLRLAYHGLRAKDKSFNAAMKTDYDEAAIIINIIPQDIGRAVLNLITNAFYAVNEKKNAVAVNKETALPYQPMVWVSTKKTSSKVEIRVKDNGNGIPPKVLEKIFQPFFTTKPTGQGTGLGLSLCYDIIKAHGGELKVETKEGEGSEFIILLPFN